MLSRCGVLEPGPVNYVKLLERFQDRSDQGKFWYDLVRFASIYNQEDFKSSNYEPGVR